MRAWPPASRALLAMFLLNCIALNLILGWVTHDRTALFYAARILNPSRLSTADSWRPMQVALQFLDDHPGQPVYQAVLFDQRVKFQYPPSSLLPFKALESLSLPIDAVTLNAWSRVALVAVAFMTLAIFRRSLRHRIPAAEVPGATSLWIWAALAAGFTLTFYPLAMGFYEGQIQTWVTLLFSGVVFAWMSGRIGLAGVLCGCMVAIKPQWGLMLPWALVRRQWGFAGGLTATLAVIATASIWVFGLASHVDYLHALQMMARHGEVFYANQSVNGLLNRWIFSSCSGPPTFFAPYHPAVYAGTIVTSLAIAGLAIFFRSGEHSRAPTIDLSIAALSFTMASPIAWDQHYGIMLPVFAVAVAVALARRRDAGALWFLGAAYALSSNDFVTPGCPSRLMNVIQSHLFFGAVLLMIVLYRMRHQLNGTTPA
jgi:hypothetical protein